MTYMQDSARKPYYLPFFLSNIFFTITDIDFASYADDNIQQISVKIYKKSSEYQKLKQKIFSDIYRKPNDN